MHLTKLPLEVLLTVANHVRNIEDFTSFTSTCNTLRQVGLATSPESILGLCSRSAPTFFSPRPHYLVAATAHRLSQVCLGNEALTAGLHTAFKSGIEGLYQYALQHSGITLKQLRHWYLARFSTINPLSDRIDKMVGNQWYQLAEDFWDGGVSEANTITCEAVRTTFQIIIYGELFKGSMDILLNPSNYSEDVMTQSYFGVDTRLEYIKYCIPDWICRSYPGFEVERAGVYASNDNLGPLADQTALQHLLHCGRWKRMWRGILRQVGPDFWQEEEEEKRLEAQNGYIFTIERMNIVLDGSADKIRQLLWWNAAVMTGGIEGMQAAKHGGITNTKVKEVLVEESEISVEVRLYLTKLRARISSLSEEQLFSIGSHGVGQHVPRYISNFPDFGKEVAVCMLSLWGWGQYQVWGGREAYFAAHPNISGDEDASEEDAEP